MLTEAALRFGILMCCLACLQDLEHNLNIF